MKVLAYGGNIMKVVKLEDLENNIVEIKTSVGTIVPVIQAEVLDALAIEMPEYDTLEKHRYPSKEAWEMAKALENDCLKEGKDGEGKEASNS